MPQTLETIFPVNYNTGWPRGNYDSRMPKAGYTDYNPVRDVEKPKDHSEHKENEELNILKSSEIRVLFENTPRGKGNSLALNGLILTGLSSSII